MLPQSRSHKTKEDCTKETKPKLMFAGIGAAILASLSFSIGYVCVKLLPNGKSVSEKAKALFIRGLIMVAISVIAVLYKRSTVKVRRAEIWVISLRCLFGTMSIFGAYLALNYIPIGDTMALKFSSPVWTSLLGYFLLKEPLQMLLIIALPASIFGILMIAQPALIIGHENFSRMVNQNISEIVISVDDQNNNLFDSTFDLKSDSGAEEDPQKRWLGITLALSTSLCISFIYIVLKFRKTTPIVTTTFWSSVTMTLAGFIVMCCAGFGEMPHSSFEWILLVGNGFSSWLGQCFLQYALANADASICSVIRTLDVALAFVWSAILLDDDIYWTSIIGAIVIIGVVLLIMFSNWMQKVFCNPRGSRNISTNA